MALEYIYKDKHYVNGLLSPDFIEIVYTPETDERTVNGDCNVAEEQYREIVITQMKQAQSTLEPEQLLVPGFVHLPGDFDND